MPEISKVEPQKKHEKRFNIFLDGQFAFGISDENLLKNNLKIGKKLSDEDIAKILSSEETGKLTDIATNFLSYRPRSEKEIVDHLTKKISVRDGVKFQEAQESPLIAKVINKLKRYKYINDLEFARWYVESRLRSRPRALAVIKMELRRKGIQKEIIESVTQSSDDELTLAKNALLKKAKRWQKLSNVDLKKKVYQYLASRGFGFETIKEAFAMLTKKR